MNRAIAQLRQFRHPVPNIPRRIELIRLRQGRHDPNEHIAVYTGPRGPLPVDAIASIIGIKQRVPEPLLTLSPVDQQMFDEKRSRDHPDPIVHPTSRPKLPHSGIDDWVAGPPLLPRS